MELLDALTLFLTHVQCKDVDNNATLMGFVQAEDACVIPTIQAQHALNYPHKVLQAKPNYFYLHKIKTAWLVAIEQFLEIVNLAKKAVLNVMKTDARQVFPIHC